MEQLAACRCLLASLARLFHLAAIRPDKSRGPAAPTGGNYGRVGGGVKKGAVRRSQSLRMAPYRLMVPDDAIADIAAVIIAIEVGAMALMAMIAGFAGIAAAGAAATGDEVTRR
jgi:hypothetical protein